jgi:hypothetical protein
VELRNLGVQGEFLCRARAGKGACANEEGDCEESLPSRGKETVHVATIREGKFA